MSLDVSIVIPTFNRAPLLRNALESVCALSIPPGILIECIVVDNNSSDDTRSVVEHFSRAHTSFLVRYVLEVRQGLNHGRNAGLTESSGEWTVFLDDDMLVAPGWIEAFAAAVSSLATDIVTGPVAPMFEGEVPPWCVPPVLASVTSSYSLRGPDVRVLHENEGHEIPGCNFAVRTKFGRRVGGFHPDLDRAGEAMLAGGDFEFAMRIAKAGGRACYVPGCQIRHLVSAKKMSRNGLLARWRGLGATQKRIREMHAISAPLPLHRARLRALRFRIRSWRLAFLGNPEAFRWRLEAEWLKATI